MALGIGKEGRKARRAGRRAKRKDKIASFRGDGNALKSKLGIGRSLSNKFDQRISDAFSDLLGGVLGVRTSNIPDIGGEVVTAKNEARIKRMQAISDYDSNIAKRTPQPSVILAFPKSYFNERGESEAYGDASKISGRGLSGPEYAEIKKRQDHLNEQHKRGAFPNSIHFRSLPRKKFDAEEAAAVGIGQLFGKDKDDLRKNQDVGTHGTVNPAKEETYDIFLYLPHQLGDAIKVTHESSEAGMMESFFAKLFSFGETDDEVKKNVGDNNKDANEMLQAFKSMLPGSKIVQQATGALVNPMKFQSFTGVDFRTYSYKFTLKPSSSAEALVIKEIIHAFKLSSLPGLAGENGRIWTQPNEWSIKFRGPVANFLDFPLTVACTGVDVDYSHGGAYVLMEDGSPAAYDLTVTFTETTQMARQKYAQQVSPLTRTGEGIGASERGTVTVDQKIAKNSGHSVKGVEGQGI